MSDLVLHLIRLETHLLDEGGGHFRLTLRRNPQDSTIRVQVLAPGTKEFVFDPATSATNDRQLSSDFTWQSVLAQVARVGYGEIDVEITKSGQRMVTVRRVTTSFRTLQQS